MLTSSLTTKKTVLLKLHSENIKDFWQLVFIITTNTLFQIFYSDYITY